MDEQLIDKPETKTAKKEAAKARRYKLTIYSGEDAADKGDVVLAHNFRQIMIQRDREVEVDEQYIEVLKHSVIDTFTKDENGKVTPIKVPRYSFNYTPV